MKQSRSVTANTQQATGNNLANALDRAVRRTPDKNAILFADRSWTFSALAKAANRIANQLLNDHGLQPGDRVAAYGKNSDAYLLLWLACNRANLIHVPVNYALTNDELHYILDQSGARAVFCDSDLTPHIEKIRHRLQCSIIGSFQGQGDMNVLTTATNESADYRRPDIEPDEHAVAQILYTSGTTASPKGAMMTHRALLAEYASASLALDLSSEDRALSALPLYHSAEMHAFLMPRLLLGATTLIIPAPKPETCFQLIEKQRITGFFAPPTVWISLLRHPDFDTHDLSSLTRAYYGASIMPGPVVEELQARLPGLQLYNCYGQSEIAPLATVLSPQEHKISLTSAGRPVLNVETRIVNEQMEDLPPGQMGEIVHRSPQLMVGYWNKPEETEEAFAGGWFHSGDVGCFDEHGLIYIVDRIKDVINTGGVLVSSREVEECLYKHPAVAEVAVIGIPDEKWIEAICAVVVLKKAIQASEEELIAFCRDKLARHKIPKRIGFTTDLPRNTAGKILKRELRQEYSES